MADVTVVKTSQGPRGRAGTIGVGSTSTLASGEDATVTNSGSSTEAVLDFGIPRGDALTFRGAWDNTATYALSEAVTHSDKLWAANADTDAGDEPGVSGKWTEVPVTTAPFEDVTDHGAAGDGTTDDTAAIQSAIDAANGKPVWFPEGTYRIASQLTLKANTDLRLPPGAILEPDGFAAGTPAIVADGSTSDPTALTVDASEGDTSLTVASGDEAPFAADDLVRVRSERQRFSSSKDGEFAIVESTGDGTINLTAPLFVDYATTDTATVDKVNPLDNVTIQGRGTIRAAGGTAQACLLTLCRNINIEGVTFEDFTIRTVGLAGCYDAKVRGVTVYRANDSGQGYGVAPLDGTQHLLVDGCTFIDCRHGVSGTGQSSAYGWNRMVRLIGNTCSGGVGSGLDAHANAQHWTIANNEIRQPHGATDAAITWQGQEATITGNTIFRPNGIGIYCQQVNADSVIDGLIVANNEIHAPVEGVRVLTAASNVTVRGLVIAGNSIIDPSQEGIYVHANTSGALIQDFTVGNNVVRSANSRGIWMRSNTGTIEWGTINGNRVSIIASSVGAIEAFTESASETVQRVAITGNACNGGDYGIRGSGQNDCWVDGNIALGSTAGIDGFASAELGTNQTA